MQSITNNKYPEHDPIFEFKKDFENISDDDLDEIWLAVNGFKFSDKYMINLYTEKPKPFKAIQYNGNNIFELINFIITSNIEAYPNNSDEFNKKTFKRSDYYVTHHIDKHGEPYIVIRRYDQIDMYLKDTTELRWKYIEVYPLSIGDFIEANPYPYPMSKQKFNERYIIFN